MTTPRSRGVLFWSSGKDAAYALAEVRRLGGPEVAALVTTVNAGEPERVAVHGVRRELVERQAAALGLPLVTVPLPSPCPNEVYEREIARALEPLRAAGVGIALFGDLFLEDVRAYRERQMAALGLEPRFPLWGRDTTRLAHEMLDAGVEARVVTVDTEQLDGPFGGRFAGRLWDDRLLAELPAGCDPCGENGELHTFVTRAPGFRGEVAVELGAISSGERFVHADLLPRYD